MEPGGGALLKRSIICDSPRAPCILVRGRERRKKKGSADRSEWGSGWGRKKKGRFVKLTASSRAWLALAPFHLMHASIELMMEDLLCIPNPYPAIYFLSGFGQGRCGEERS